MTIIRMLGIDPSLTATGYAVCDVDVTRREIVRVLAFDTLKTAPTKVKSVRKSSDDLARATTISRGLFDVIRDFDIRFGTSEVPSGAQDAKASRAFGIVVGILSCLPCPLIEVTPTEVKMASHGTKYADKEDVVRWAVDLTNSTDSKVEWDTSKKANDWAIEFGDGYVNKTMEHQADAIAAVAAAIQGQTFRQLAGMFASVTTS